MALKNDPAPEPVKDPPGAFDEAAFKKSVMDEVNKTINGTVKSLKNDLMKMFKPLTADPDPADPDPNLDPNPSDPAPKPPIKDPALNAEFQSLRKRLEAQERKTKEAEEREKKSTDMRLETERVTSIRSVLNDIPFKDQASRELFFKAVHSDVKRDEDGNLIADSESGPLPYKDYLQAQAEQHANLLAPKGAGGAGASAGNRSGGRGRFTAADLEPANYHKLKPEEQAALHAEVLAGNVPR